MNVLVKCLKNGNLEQLTYAQEKKKTRVQKYTQLQKRYQKQVCRYAAYKKLNTETAGID